MRPVKEITSDDSGRAKGLDFGWGGHQTLDLFYICSYVVVVVAVAFPQWEIDSFVHLEPLPDILALNLERIE